jgi:hypothetical protein
LNSKVLEPTPAGAELRLGQVPKSEDRLRLGVVSPGTAEGFKGPEGRWYLFAAVGGGEVGPSGASARWQEDRASAYMATAKAGVTLRRGDAQATFGYVRRSFKVSGQQSDLLADMPKSDHLAGFAFSYTLR